MTGKSLAFLLGAGLLLFPAHAIYQSGDCQTFTSSGQNNITVDNSYGGYYLIDFGGSDPQVSDSLSVFGARESPDGGSDFRLRFSHQDLPAELPRGTVNGIEFALTNAVEESQGFWVRLGNTPQACVSVATPTALPTSNSAPAVGNHSASVSLTILIGVLVFLVLAVLIVLRTRKPVP